MGSAEVVFIRGGVVVVGDSGSGAVFDGEELAITQSPFINGQGRRTAWRRLIARVGGEGIVGLHDHRDELTDLSGGRLEDVWMSVKLLDGVAATGAYRRGRIIATFE